LANRCHSLIGIGDLIGGTILADQVSIVKIAFHSTCCVRVGSSDGLKEEDVKDHEEEGDQFKHLNYNDSS
jgi:hypothetical protein